MSLGLRWWGWGRWVPRTGFAGAQDDIIYWSLHGADGLCLGKGKRPRALKGVSFVGADAALKGPLFHGRFLYSK
ncbi:MAG TPA: hypothetical protein VKB49_10025 [Candidatus Sulfotelmatobacter sp.]|nr:hypothetical protein [Candidatus Sulfotelmatobacter sp.]